VISTDGDYPIELRDNGDGSYLATYCVPNPGTVKIKITVGEDNQDIKESPKDIPVKLSKPKIVFWKHTYEKEKEELKRLREALSKANETLQRHGLL